MSWNIVYTAGAKKDLRNLYEYIANDLCVPETAAGQAGKIMREIRGLDKMPMRYRLYGDEPWRSQGLRFFPVDNYLVFYLPEQTDNIVYIVRIIYSGRDVRKQLRDGSASADG